MDMQKAIAVQETIRIQIWKIQIQEIQMKSKVYYFF